MSTSEYLRDARIVIVGAGVIGAALGYRLAQAGARVTIVERCFAGAGTSGSSFAWINGMDKPPREYHRLNVRSIRDHEDLADEIGGDWVHVTGSLHWAATDDGARASALERSVRQLRGWGMRVDRLSPAQAIRELEPDLVIDPDAVSSVYLVHRAGWLDPMAMAHGTSMAAVERYGAELLRGEVSRVHATRGMIEGLALADGRELVADVVVDAAGPDAASLAELAGVTLSIEQSPGLLLVTAPAPARLGHPVYAAGVHLRPDGGGRVMIQWEPMDDRAAEGLPTAADDPLVDEAMARARAVMPALSQVAVEAVRLGIRPVPKDGFPIVGFDPVIANLYHVVTHSGVTLAARLALLVTEELAGGDAEPLDAYRPSRFAAGGSRPVPPASGSHA